MNEYEKFIRSKHREVEPSGFTIDPDSLNPMLFPWQRRVVSWACQQGRSAIFAECGLGKTPMQLTWAEQVIRRGNARRVLILCPLAVAAQTQREAEKFKINVQSKIVREGFEVDSGISICNYERLDKMPIESFDAVVLDESSILKGLASKTRDKLIREFRRHKFKLACTATPSPNDMAELGNHSEFLDSMTRTVMLATFFKHDSGDTSKWRLKRHSERDYWRWVTSWAMSISRPSDIGGSDEGFDLPPLNINRVVVDAIADPPAGMLFETGGVSATDIHREKRSTSELRASEVAKLCNGRSDQWLVWCDTNYEADELANAIPDAVDLRGSLSVTRKEEMILSFLDGQSRVLISKPKLAGFGLNLQQCSNMAFVGMSYSFESFYQAVRRCWRFGQSKPVDVHVIETDGEAAISRVVFDKQRAHSAMKSGIIDAVREDQMRRLSGRKKLEGYDPQTKMEMPEWLKSKTA